MTKTIAAFCWLALSWSAAHAQAKRDAYTFIGELQYNKSVYLNHREITNVPYTFFSNKYMLVCVGMDGSAQVRDTVFPKELYYDRHAQAVEARFTIPKTAFSNGKNSLRLVGRIVRKSDYAVVGAINDPIVLQIPQESDPAYINGNTFKLSGAIKVGSPAEVSVATIVDYLKEKLTVASDSNDLPGIVSSLSGNAHRRYTTRDYYRLIEFIEPYIGDDAFLSREAAELHDSLLILQAALSTTSGTKQQSGYYQSRQVYEEYCSFYADLKQYYIKASKKIQGGTPMWLELGGSFRLADGMNFNGLYAGAFLHTRPRNFAYPYRGPKLQIFSVDATVLPGKYDLLKRKSWKPGFSFFGALYNSNTTGISEDAAFGRHYHTLTSRVPSPGVAAQRAWVYSDSGQARFTQQLRYITLLLSPRIDLLQHARRTSAFRLEAGLHTELQFQQYTYKKDLSALRRVDTIRTTLDSAARNYTDSTATTLDRSENRLAYYVGLELPFEFSSKTFDIILTPVAGFTNQISLQSGAPASIDDALKPFVAARVTLNEKLFGVGITGEVKLPIGGDGKPFVALSIIKKINVRALLRGALLLED